MAAHVRVLCVGAMKQDCQKKACDDYVQMLSRYARVTIEEVDDERAPETLSERQVREALRREGERLLKRIPAGDTVIALCIDGEKVSSAGLAKKLDAYMTRGASRLTFVIGSSLGLSGEVIARADWKLSFSDLTFPHQLMRVMLSEQIYRAFSILAGTPYHK